MQNPRISTTESTIEYNNTGAIHTDPELDRYLESIQLSKHLEELQRQKRITIAQMNDAVDRGQNGKRKQLLNAVILLDNEIRKVEQQIKIRCPVTLKPTEQPQPISRPISQSVQPKERSVVLHAQGYKDIDVSTMSEQYIKLWRVGDCYVEYR